MCMHTIIIVIIIIKMCAYTSSSSLTCVHGCYHLRYHHKNIANDSAIMFTNIGLVVRDGAWACCIIHHEVVLLYLYIITNILVTSPITSLSCLTTLILYWEDEVDGCLYIQTFIHIHHQKVCVSSMSSSLVITNTSPIALSCHYPASHMLWQWWCQPPSSYEVVRLFNITHVGHTHVHTCHVVVMVMFSHHQYHHLTHPCRIPHVNNTRDSV